MVSFARLLACAIAVSPLINGLSQMTDAQRQVLGRPPVVKGRTAEVIRKMTPAQRVHAKLHVDPHDYKEQPDQILDEQFWVTRFIDTMGGLQPTRSTSEILAESVCSSDAVFVGQVQSATALPTLTGAFLFTDYQIQITRLIRVRPKFPQPPLQVIVTRLGGVWVGDGVEIRAEITTWPLLEVGGMYVFFGTLIPDTGAYISRKSDVLRIINDKARAVAGLHDTSDLEWYEGLNATSFIARSHALNCPSVAREARK